MMFLMEYHWGWLAGAGVLGLVMGWIGGVHRGRGLSKRGLQIAALILVVAIGCAIARIVPGRAGYWLDLGLALFAVYILGCTIGAWLRDLLIPDHRSTS